MASATRMPMTTEQSDMLLRMLLSGSEIDLTENDKPFLYKVIESRLLASFKFTMSPNAILFMCLIAGNPGSAILYLWYLQYLSVKDKFESINLQKICELFPIGFIPDDELSRIWNGQKCSLRGSDNLVDHAQYGKSILK